MAPDQLHKLGYKLALYPVLLLSSSIAAMQATLEGLWPRSKTPQPPTISFTDLQSVVGFPDYWSRETRYQAKELGRVLIMRRANVRFRTQAGSIYSV